MTLIRRGWFAVPCLCLVLASCAAGPRLTLEDGRSLNSPPVGSVLVNFHRPADEARLTMMPVFDGKTRTLIGGAKGETRFQYICRPGTRHFVMLDPQKAVVEAHLEPDRVYDIVMVAANGRFSLEPIGKRDPRREKVWDWESSARIVVCRKDEPNKAYEDASEAKLDQVIKEYAGGSKRPKVLKADAHR
ncbi:MAG: hypothetical protein ACYS0E_22035 [Planctomycetota bacterium]|jgi:hypothetical protein